MSKNWIPLYVASLLLLSIVACTNAGDQAQDSRIIDDAYIEGLQAKEEPLASEGPLGQISSESTTIPSDQFPHTKPVQIQHAKYDFIIVDGQHADIRLTREDIARLLPEEIARLIPEGAERLTPEQVARLVPEGTTRLTPEDIVQRLRQGTPQQPPQAPAQEQPEQREQPETTTQPEVAEGVSEIEARVIELTNAERRRNGLSDLQTDAALNRVAREKSNDMQANHYFSHTSPTYGSPFDMMRDFGISFNAAAENIAQGQPTPEAVVQAWMNSEGHRANILNGNFTHIGVGYNENGHYWTQMFISK
ncbi:putative YkwD family protein [Caldalkalibacillus uzonensis]|uniref:YkwD family protein n=1 Tax=Caldalkalibacillus uzonensis TaxID=353224 RepID=A0ABU0CLY9_9BACI|nr:CAP domain-containing protein [Caldalkalibacillus uzonensis]MDQ0337436.1 putative YkwD family protein [Caldalkalibacillus uzonensis]